MDLQKIAKRILADALSSEPTRYNTSMIMDEYGLNEQQSRRVKQYVKEYGRNLGVLWGWDPVAECFRIAPSNAQHVADRMKTYVLEHWQAAGVMAVTSFEAAERQGYADAFEVSRVHRVHTQFEQTLADGEAKP